MYIYAQRYKYYAILQQLFKIAKFYFVLLNMLLFRLFHNSPYHESKTCQHNNRRQGYSSETEH